MKRHDNPLTPEQIAVVPDSAIDFSEIPELDEDFWREADRTSPTAPSRLRYASRLPCWLISKLRKGYQTRINKVLERYIRSLQRLHPPGWLIGTDWQGHPDDAMMRVTSAV